MNSGHKARIAIVGAGPAGAAAGWHLASRGFPVALMDRAPFPRDKTCGDWLTPAALSELSALGLSRAFLNRLAPGYATVTTTRLVSPDGRESTRASGNPGACVPRRVLDHLVRERALAAGCEPLERTIRDIASEAESLADYDHIVHPSVRSVFSREIGLWWKVRRSRAAL